MIVNTYYLLVVVGVFFRLLWFLVFRLTSWLHASRLVAPLILGRFLFYWLHESPQSQVWSSEIIPFIETAIWNFNQPTRCHLQFKSSCPTEKHTSNGSHPAGPVHGYPIAQPPPPPQAAAPTLEEGLCSSDADCSSENPICSEFGHCQCPSYQPGGKGCWDLEAPPSPAPASAPVEEKYEDHYGSPAVPSYRGPLQTPL